MTIPVYSLIDHISWLTTRHIPLDEQSVDQLMVLINASYQSYTTKFAGITTENNINYYYLLSELSNNQDFFDNAANVIISPTLFNFIDYEYLVNNANFDSATLTQFLNCVEMTEEFSGFLSQLEGITPETSQDPVYRDVIQNGLYYCPKFLKDAQTFPYIPS